MIADATGGVAILRDDGQATSGLVNNHSASFHEALSTMISKCSNEPPEAPGIFRTKNQVNLQRMGSEF